ENVLRRVARLPLFSSAAQIVTATYADLKGRYPLVGLVGGVAAISIRRMSLATARSSTPLLQRLEPQISMANSYACVGLDELEKRFPVLQQSAEEVVGRLKDTLFLTMDDLQLRMNEGMGRVVGRTEQVMEQTRAAIQANVMSIQNSSLGGTVVSVLDELLTRSEEAAVYYLPLPDALREFFAPPEREWELSLQRYEEEEDDDDEEPGLWSRARYLGLHVGLLLQHWAGMLRDSLRQRALVLGDLSDTVGLTWLLEAALALSQRLLGFYLAQVYRMEELRSLVVSQLVLLARMFLDLRPVRAALTFPGQVQSTLMVVMRDLWELSQILIQLLINTTPLYNMVRILSGPSEPLISAKKAVEHLSMVCKVTGCHLCSASVKSCVRHGGGGVPSDRDGPVDQVHRGVASRLSDGRNPGKRAGKPTGMTGMRCPQVPSRGHSHCLTHARCDRLWDEGSHRAGLGQRQQDLDNRKGSDGKPERALLGIRQQLKADGMNPTEDSPR
ncbi:hypothetical protein Z043_122017, partial [Scleropages formosus]